MIDFTLNIIDLIDQFRKHEVNEEARRATIMMENLNTHVNAFVKDCNIIGKIITPFH